MKKVLIVTMFLFCAVASARCTTKYLGGRAYTDCDNGYRSTTQNLGGFEYTDHYYQGQRKQTRCKTIGNTVYCD